MKLSLSDKMYRIRAVELEIARRYPGPGVTERSAQDIACPVHLCIGEEAPPVGVCDILNKSDVVFGTYRSHGVYLAKGGDLRRLVHELYGRETGCSGGRGGSMSLYDAGVGVMPTSGIVGTSIPNAVGYAYAMRVRKQDHVVAAFFGEGAADEGVFYESLNFAAVHALPVLFVCLNNGMAIDTPVDKRRPRTSIYPFAETFLIDSTRCDGSPEMVKQIRRFARIAVDAMRGGKGPKFMECSTHLYNQHIGTRLEDNIPDLSERIDPVQRDSIDREIKEAFNECAAGE
jgi:TPP-dependent pyruvate/acetoin dehydrogenase alpha subunit